MESTELNRLTAAMERQTKLLEQIAKATERSNEILFSLLSEEQRSALSKRDVERAAANITKSQKTTR